MYKEGLAAKFKNLSIEFVGATFRCLRAVTDRPYIHRMKTLPKVKGLMHYFATAPLSAFGKIIFQKITFAVAGDDQQVPLFVGGHVQNGEAPLFTDICNGVVGFNLKDLPYGIFRAAAGVDILGRYFVFFHIPKILISLLFHMDRSGERYAGGKHLLQSYYQYSTKWLLVPKYFLQKIRFIY